MPAHTVPLQTVVTVLQIGCGVGSLITTVILCHCVQSKEKLIASLKESPSSGGKSVNDSAALVSELESIRQERDVLQDELRSSQHATDSIRSELAVSNTNSVSVCTICSVLLTF